MLLWLDFTLLIIIEEARVRFERLNFVYANLAVLRPIMLSMTALTAITAVLTTASVVHLIYMCFQFDCCFELRLRD